MITRLNESAYAQATVPFVPGTSLLASRSFRISTWMYKIDRISGFLSCSSCLSVFDCFLISIEGSTTGARTEGSFVALSRFAPLSVLGWLRLGMSEPRARLSKCRALLERTPDIIESENWFGLRLNRVLRDKENWYPPLGRFRPVRLKWDYSEC